MKTTEKIILLLVLFLTISGCSSLTPVAMKGSISGKKQPGRTETVVASDNATQKETETVDESLRFPFSIDMGKAGLQIPAFTDLNGSKQDAYKIRSHDFLIQAGLEKILSKPLHGPLTWGLKGKLGLAYTFWPTQQGGGEPGNYFASTGSFYTAGKGLHSGDIINIVGLWWSFTPELTSHYSINSYLELGAAAGLSLYGYTGMTIKDPWTGYSTSISDEAGVGHSLFLQNHFPSFSQAFDWSVDLLIKAPGKGRRIFIETGMTGPSWIIGLGIESLLSKGNK
jgi:hypothetical protein